MKYLILLFSIGLFTACGECEQHQLVEELQSELADAKAANEHLSEQLAVSEDVDRAPLVHIVLLNIKDDLTEEERKILDTEIEKLAAIEEVKKIEVGGFYNLDDPRALSEYEIVMEMRFEDVAAYLKYQNHETHLALKAALGPFLAAPPAVYDYWK